VVAEVVVEMLLILWSQEEREPLEVEQVMRDALQEELEVQLVRYLVHLL
tara:strand:- start:417 stop:563 length:147 start_codon:yes stop_codon:yes gene_type:complete